MVHAIIQIIIAVACTLLFLFTSLKDESLVLFKYHEKLAQLEEHLSYTQNVVGSNPTLLIS